MSIEKRRRYKKRSKSGKDKTEKKPNKRRGLPKKELSQEEIEARKKAQRLSMFDKKKNPYKRK